jgi:hypothetical protein
VYKHGNRLERTRNELPDVESGGPYGVTQAQPSKLGRSNLAPRIENYVLLIHDSKQPPEEVMPFLPATIRNFVAKTCAMTDDDVKACWECAGGLIWDGDEHWACQEEETNPSAIEVF